MNPILREFLDKPLPEKTGWAHVFGSLLLILFATQFITGILITFVYAPTPLSAFQSMTFLQDEFPGGAWIRSLHYWGASFIVVALFLHLARTFLFAAYRPPRQWLWISGVVLLLLTLAFAQTGYLLPWDQKAYWGTEVTLNIISSAPFAGPKIAHLLKGGTEIGALTLSRFYSFHVVILPLLTILLVVLHILLLRRHGLTWPWTRTGEEPPRTIPFYPYQMAKDATAMLLGLGLLFVIASLVPAPLDLPADPGDDTYVPRPDWYFLFLFRLIRYFRGSSEILGTFVIPFGLILALFLLPFYDRNPERRLRFRPLALLVFGLLLISWGYLTASALKTKPSRASWLAPSGTTIERPARIKKPSDVGGMHVLKQRCFECHSLSASGVRSNLQTLVNQGFPTGGESLIAHLEAIQRAADLTASEITELMSVLSLVRAGNLRSLYTIPPSARLGAHLFFNHSCINCHVIDGQGGKMEESNPRKGPDLTYRLPRKREWHAEHIKDPRSLVKNSKMPPFMHFAESEYLAMADYMLYLHTP